MADAIKIDGLAEFSRNLRKLDSDLPKALRVGLNDAVNIVVNYARPRIPTRTGTARKSLRANSTRTEARIAAGGRRAPYFPWLDFGGKGPGNRPAKRPFYKDGRYLWKGYIVKRDELNAGLVRALVGVAEQAGIEVT
jgi:hypothetical protein